jgi:predicted MFS family arabinose efflux permease
MAKSFEAAVKTPALAVVFVLSVLIGVGSQGLFLYWAIVMQQLAGWNTAAVGSFFATISLLLIIGSKASALIKPDWKSVAFIMLVLAVSLALASWLVVPAAIALMILVWELFWAIYQPIENAIVNHNTTSSMRATVISVKALFYRIGWVILGGFIGIFGIGDPRSLWLFGSFFFLLGAILALFASIKNLPSAMK